MGGCRNYSSTCWMGPPNPIDLKRRVAGDVWLRTTLYSHDVGSQGSNLSHFWRAKNLSQVLRISKNALEIPKYHARGYSLVKIQLMMPAQRWDMIICLRPVFSMGCNLSHFALFVLGSTHLLQIFLGYVSKSKIPDFVLGCTGNLQRKKLRADKSLW